MPVAGVPTGGSSSGDSTHGRDGQDRRPVLLLQGDPAGAPLLPEWVPLVGLDLGNTNVVPVDWVAGALDHIAHEPDLDGQAFHLTDPAPPARGRGDQRARAGRRTRRASPYAVDKRLTRPAAALAAAAGAGAAAVARRRRPGAARAGDPAGGARAHRARAPLRHARDRAGAGRVAAGASHRRCTSYAVTAVGLLGARDRPGHGARAHAARGASRAGT